MSVPKKGKTVYVLGAGFSAGAKFPVQSALYDIIKDPFLFSEVDLEEPPDYLSELKDHHEKITEFCKTAFCESEIPQSLEDVFTLLDQTIHSNSHFAKYSVSDLHLIRDSWIRLLIWFFHFRASQYIDSGNSSYQRFSAALLKKRIEAQISGDPLSILSLNWDSLLEDSFYSVIKNTDGIQKADIDYCVYTTPIEGSPHTPSTKQKASGIYNLKLLKLHGSTTWLRCPNSNHIYTGLGHGSSSYEVYVKDQDSPFTAKLYPDYPKLEKPPKLEPYIITPTFTKVFNQPHIQTTWHNAYVELREAKRVVFIGYSLPQADYHFRTLLLRAIRKDTEIHLILHENDRPRKLDEMGDNQQPYRDQNSTVFQYQKLFGKERINRGVRYDGVEAFIDELLQEENYQATLKFLKTKLTKHKTYWDLKASDS